MRAVKEHMSKEFIEKALVLLHEAAHEAQSNMELILISQQIEKLEQKLQDEENGRMATEK